MRQYATAALPSKSTLQDVYQQTSINVGPVLTFNTKAVETFARSHSVLDADMQLLLQLPMVIGCPVLGSCHNIRQVAGWVS